MFNKLKIGTKVVVLVISLVLLAIISESTVSYYRNKYSIKENHIAQLEILSKFYEQNINKKFKTIDNNLQILKDELPKEQIQILEKYTYTSRDTTLMWVEHFKTTYFNPIQNVNQFDEIYLLNPKGDILYQHLNYEQIGDEFRNIDHDIIDIHKPKFYINAPIYEKGAFYYYITLPINKLDGTPLAIIVAKLNTERVILECKPQLNKQFASLDFVCVKKYKNEIFRLGSNETDSKKYFPPAADHPVSLATAGKKGNGEYKDRNNVRNLAYWEYFKPYGFALLVKINSKDVFKNLEGFNLITMLIGIGILFISLVLSMFFARILSLPMLKLKKALGLVANGVLPRELHSPLEDEIGNMIGIVNKIVKSLKKTAAFAQSIGEGDFNTDFKPISSKDTLGHALVNMRASLQTADEKDVLRNWIVSGIAEISEILRDNDSVSKLGNQILDYICLRIDAVQGAFYIVNFDNPNDLSIESRASYAYQKEKHLTKTFKMAEGLIGQSAVEKDVILRTEIPEDYMDISTGILGDVKPSCILVVPLIYNDTVYGIIELAGLSKFGEDKVEFMVEVSEIIARTIFNINVNENTKKLLEESQRMSSELQVKQDELQQNAVEMKKTQEKLTISNTELEQRIEEVNHAQHRTQALLQNASEVITIYDENKIVQYVSPSVEAILGYREKDLVNKSDITHLTQKGQEQFIEMFDRLLNEEDLKLTITLQYFKKNGEKIWLEATGKNMLTTPAIEGIIVNYRDITEKIRAEEEEKKRGQMQALSENSPDLITRISKEKSFFYINPTIKTLTGKSPVEFLNKEIMDLNLPDNVLDQWSELVDTVLNEKEKRSLEMMFPTISGDRIMTVNAIPELEEDSKELESILMVSHDITEQKEIENEIKLKNKKINDSINYAEMIQDAVLPNTSIIHEHLPQSFIYFKPRDVVSGDFPWYYIKGDSIYVAAVDCTGHGVPGALISLVGYFLLNNIMESDVTPSAGELLDKLDKAVTETFRQNEESSKIKDGMDIALCKINKNSGNIEYAGANRPLYLLKNNTIEEVKGDKFPIGGGTAYTNKTNFTNNVVEVKEGDSFYFFSDGFPDQFGGENKRSKFGGKRIRDILLEQKDNSIFEIEQALHTSFIDWMGDVKQTDDVLMIGIRL